MKCRIWTLKILKFGIIIIKQVRRYRIRIKKFINAYSGKIIKIYQIWASFSRSPATPLIGSPEGKSLKIDTISQNRLNAIKNNEI